MRSMSYVTVLIAATVLGVSCERVKSANPLSPLAGPIAGVDITVPHLLKPETGEKFKPTQQPVTLIFENAATTSPRPLYYTIEIAADSSFNNMVVRRTNLAPGEGRTQYTLEGSLALGHTYFWRARGEDGANSGEYSPVRHFEVQQPVVIQAPIPDSPTGGETIGNRRPTLTVNNAGRSGPHNALQYQFEIGLDQALAQRIWDAGTFEEPGQTRLSPHFDLAPGTMHFWRVRVHDGETVGPWSRVESFRTGAAATPGPSTPPGSGAPCVGPLSPLGILNCHRARYGTPMNHDERLEFLRGAVRDFNVHGVPDGPFGLLRKPSGNNCGGYSCDVICAGQGSNQRQWDVLVNEEVPTWGGPIEGNIRVDDCEIQ
jgi:hypothetical protein